MGCTDGESIYDIPGAAESWDRDCRERRNEAFDLDEVHKETQRQKVDR